MKAPITIRLIIKPMINRNQLLIYLFILFSFVACEKWNETPRNDTNGLILRIENEDHESIENFEYNRNNYLKSSWHQMFYFYTGSKAEYNYEFNSKGLLIKKEGFEPGNPIMSSLQGAMDKDITYTYQFDANDRILNRISDYNYNEYADINYSVNYNYEYPNNTTIIEQMNLINELANDVSNYREFTYSNKGNISKLTTYHLINTNEKREYSIEEYTYDNKKVPVSFDNLPQSKNNVTEKKITVYNYDENNVQSTAYVSIYTYEYTYNNDNYPKSRTEILPNEEVIIQYYFYKK